MKKNNPEVSSNSISMISATTKIVGEVFSDSDIRIDGNIEGNINSKAKIVLGTSANLKGDIICQNADISCATNGNIYVENLLKLNATAQVKGDIFTKKLIVESGAVFIGRCEMGHNKGVEDLVGSSVTQNNKPNNYIRYTTLGFQILGSVLLGVFVGQWLDKKYHSENSLFTIILSLVMIIVSLYQVIKTFKDN
jgi:cytoskeletal protein CcmA (bactofilin family)